MQLFWRKYDKTERDGRRKAERAATEQRKAEEELKEAKRQQRKFNFLITQTELYAHFMHSKITNGTVWYGMVCMIKLVHFNV